MILEHITTNHCDCYLDNHEHNNWVRVVVTRSEVVASKRKRTTRDKFE
jgi:hypothetical protein